MGSWSVPQRVSPSNLGKLWCRCFFKFGHGEFSLTGKEAAIQINICESSTVPRWLEFSLSQTGCALTVLWCTLPNMGLAYLEACCGKNRQEAPSGRQCAYHALLRKKQTEQRREHSKFLSSQRGISLSVSKHTDISRCWQGSKGAFLQIGRPFLLFTSELPTEHLWGKGLQRVSWVVAKFPCKALQEHVSIFFNGTSMMILPGICSVMPVLVYFARVESTSFAIILTTTL